MYCIDCQILIERGASVTEEDYQNRNTPLTLAASSRCNRVKTICTLLKASSMVMTDGLLKIIKEKNKLTSDLLTSLLCNEIAIEDECKEKMTPFYIKDEFSEEVEANIVGPLRKLGFDLDSRTNSGDTVLLSACKSRCKATLLAELAKFSSMNNKEPYLPLIVMSDRSDEDTKLCIESILTEAKSPIDQMNEIHRTAVIESVRKRKQNTLKHLLASGASPNKRDRFGKTALHYCVESEMFDDEVCDMLSILFETKPKVDIKDKRGRTVLNQAACHATKSRIQTFNMLMKQRYAVETVDILGKTPLHNCLEFVNEFTKMQTVERLCRLTILMIFGADPYCSDDKDKTVIDICNESSSQSFAEELNILNQENIENLPSVFDAVLPPDDCTGDDTGDKNDAVEEFFFPSLNPKVREKLQRASRYLQGKSLKEAEPIVFGFMQNMNETNIAIPFKVDK